MIDFLAENWGTLLVGAAVLAAIVSAAARLIKDKRSGKACSGCPGCGKGGCTASSAACRHKK